MCEITVFVQFSYNSSLSSRPLTGKSEEEVKTVICYPLTNSINVLNFYSSGTLNLWLFINYPRLAIMDSRRWTLDFILCAVVGRKCLTKQDKCGYNHIILWQYEVTRTNKFSNTAWDLIWPFFSEMKIIPYN